MNRKAGWHNVDKYAVCRPDEIVDLESFPWPWADSSAEEVLFNHSLEHMGQSPDAFIGIMRELWRVCTPGALVQINVPDPRHDNFIGDPTHVRPVTAGMLALFSQRANRQWAADGAANSPLALIHGIDFELENHERAFEEPWASLVAQGRMGEAELEEAVRRHNNVVRSHRFLLVAIK